MNQSDRVDEAETRFEASPDQVFAAYSDAALVTRWMPPEGMRAEVEHWTVEPGADYAMTLIYTGDDAPKGKAGGGRDEVRGRFLAVERPTRIVQEAEFPSDDPASGGTMRLEWNFTPDGDGTRATVRASSVPASIDPADHRKVLRQTLEQLGHAAARQALPDLH